MAPKKRDGAPSTSGAPTAASSTPAPPPPREPTRRLTLDIPERLHRDMKIRAATTGVTMLDEVRALLEVHYSDTGSEARAIEPAPGGAGSMH